MALRAISTIENLIESWLKFVHRYASLITILILITTVLVVFYIKDNLGINTDTTDMLSEELEWRQDYIQFKNAFPQFTDNIAIVIEADTPDQVQDAAIALSHRLHQESDLFPAVFQIENSDFFRKNSLLYLDTNELENLANNLASVQPFLAKLQQDLNLRGLFSLLTQALEDQQADIDLDRIFTSINQTLVAQINHKRQRMSWHELMSERAISQDDLRAVITVQPKLDYSSLLPGKPAVEALRKIIDAEDLINQFGAHARLTGSAALAYEELDSVMRGAELGGIIALIAVTVILIVGLRSFSLLIATLITLITGLIWTAAFAAFAIGQLNMISVAFMVLYIGLGVDFAIHLCLRFREKRIELDQRTALLESGKHVGASLLLCATTTAIGFYAFLPTAYAGVAELGLISGTGMFISLFLSLTLLPALISLLPYKVASNKPLSSGRFARLHRLPVKYARSIVMISMTLSLASLLALPFIRFDHNPVHLMDPHSESVQTYQDLLTQSSRSPLSISILGHEIGNLPTRLKTLDTVENVITINSFIPSDQADKLPVIEDLSLMMALDEEIKLTTIDDQARKLAITEFDRALNASLEHGHDSQAAKSLHETLRLYLQNNAANLALLEQDLLASLPGRLHNLQDSLLAEEVTPVSIPPDLAERWVAKGTDHRTLYRIEVFPAADLDDNSALTHFVKSVRDIAPGATDTPVINLEASRAVIKAFLQAFSLALLVISLLLWWLMDNKYDVILALVPLILAGLFTAAASVLFHIPFNFANIIALPLLLGIGVDSAVHILHRYRTALPEDGLLLNTSTARAVLFSALTTVSSFGNLAISPHQGTASMGILLTIGLSLTLIVTLVIMPSLLSLITERVKPS